MTRCLMSFAALTTTFAVLGTPSSAQLSATPAFSSNGPRIAGGNAVQPRFKNGVDLVSLDVCVTDATGRLMSGLTADDFLVLENGKAQPISFVMPSGAVPLTAVLLIDRSTSMYGAKLERALEAARLFAGLLGPDDRLEIIAFNQRAERVHAFDDDPQQVPAALTTIRVWGGTALYEALLVAANDVVRARGGAPTERREAVIVLSDGEDTASVVGFEEVLPVLRRSGALIYTVSLRAGVRGDWLGATWPLLEMARDTGGRALGVPRLEAVPALYAEINAEVRHLYRIGYVSTDERRDGQWRAVSVRVPSRDARVRTRAGYYASREPSTGVQP